MGLAETPAAGRLTLGRLAKMIVALFKLRIVVLLLFAAMGGAFLGAGGLPPAKTLLVLLFTGTLAAGGASAINQYLEQDTDSLMRRTQRRPLASGQIRHPMIVLWVAVMMVIVAVLSVLPANPVMAFYLGLGALIYVGVYTIWLKPRSILNIVIGGAAGSCAVMAGGAAVGSAHDPAVIALALLVFLWTPVHFWALAMFYKDEYATANVPMLPVRAKSTHTAWWIFIHALSTGITTIVLAATPVLGWPYLIPAGLITLAMIAGSVHLIQRSERKQAIKLFVTSNIYLAVVFLSIMLVTVGRQLF